MSESYFKSRIQGFHSVHSITVIIKRFPEKFLFQVMENTTQHHDVYDATSRSVELPPLIESLTSNQTGKDRSGNRKDLLVEGARVFVIENFFSPSECEFFISATESKVL
jgi:hypothetical protein